MGLGHEKNLLFVHQTVRYLLSDYEKTCVGMVVFIVRPTDNLFLRFITL